jgi:hypothetical protein
MFDRPEPDEYAPYYANYIGKVPEGDIRDLLRSELPATIGPLRRLPAERETHAYAEGKWSIREVVGHLIDAERVFAYRALTFARGDVGPLPSMEEKDWAAISNAGARPLRGLLDELEALRASHVALFAGLAAGAAMRRGAASDAEFPVRALAYILVGHEIHTRGVLRDRYGVG